jgi:N-acylmannosamine kinase
MTAQLDGFALDLGGTKIAAARIAGGQIIAREAASTSAQDDAAAQIAVMAGLAARVGHQPGAPLGVAVAGRIDAAGRWQAVNTDTLGSIGAVPIAELIEAALGPAACLNDAAAAALAEARLGAGRSLDNFAFVTVSTGVGGGLVLGGRLLSSATGLAGHVGFTTTPCGTEACGSGRRGTVESVASGRAMAAAARAMGHDTDARAICDAARRGEGWAEAIVDRSAQAIATLIADLTATLGLDGVAIGGGIGLSEGYIARVRAALHAEPSLFRAYIASAAFGADAPLIGALLHRLDGGCL